MVNVIYYRRYNRVTVEGHAKSDEVGKDLVCAAASILAMTLADNIAYMQDVGVVRNAVIKLEPGNAEIGCVPISKYKATVAHTMQAICVGFEILAHNSPDYITYSVHG